MHLHPDDFARWLHAFGSNLDRWPAMLRHHAVQHLAGSAESRAAWRRAGWRSGNSPPWSTFATAGDRRPARGRCQEVTGRVADS